MRKKLFLLLVSCLAFVGNVCAEELGEGESVKIPDTDIQVSRTVDVPVKYIFNRYIPGTEEVPDKGYRGFQLQIVLPEGITCTAVKLNPALASYLPDYQIQQSIKDGELRILGMEIALDLVPLNSNLDPSLLDEEGYADLCYMTLAASEDLEAGEDLAAEITHFEFDYATKVVLIPQESFTLTTVEKEPLPLSEEDTDIAEATTKPDDYLVTRTLKAGNWSTICLPFDMTTEEMKEAFGDEVALADFDSYDTNEVEEDDDPITNITVNFQTVTSGIEKNHPYLIKTSKNVESFTMKNITLDPDEAACHKDYKVKVPKVGWVLFGSFIGTLHNGVDIKPYLDENDETVRPLFLSGNKFYYSSESTNPLKGFRGYFTFRDVLTDVASANIGIAIDNEVDYIEGISTVHYANGAVYTISGMYVGKDIDLNKLPSGIYIVNNKKVVVK